MEQMQQMLLQQNQMIMQMMAMMQQQQPAPVVQQQQQAQPAPVIQQQQQPAPQQRPPRRKSAWQLYLAIHKPHDRHLFSGGNHNGSIGGYNQYLQLKRNDYNDIKQHLSIVNGVLHINNDGNIVPYVVEQDVAPVVEEQPAPVVEQDVAPVVEEQPAPVVEQDVAPVVEEQPFSVYSRMEHNDNLYLQDFLMTYSYPDEQHIISRYRYATELIRAFNDMQVRQARFEARFFEIMQNQHNNNRDMLLNVRAQIHEELTSAFQIITNRSPNYRRYADIPKTNLTFDERVILGRIFDDFCNVWNNLMRRKRAIFRRFNAAYDNVRGSPLFTEQQPTPEELEQERVRREEFRQQQAELQANPRPPVDIHNENECPNCIEPYADNGIYTCGTCNYQMCNVCVEHIRAGYRPRCPQCRQNL